MAWFNTSASIACIEVLELSEPVPYPSSSAAYPVINPIKKDSLVESEVSVEPAPVESAEPIDSIEPIDVEQASIVQQPSFFALRPVTVEPVAEVEPELEPEPQAEVEPELEPEPEPEAEAESKLEPEPEVVSTTELEQNEPKVEDPISPFEISATLTLEPQTNSIVIDQIPDPIRSTDIFTDAGMILKTGSIEIVPVTTGQIEIIPESPESDVADSMDSAASFVPSVAPLRASGVMNSKAQVGALPTRRRRVMDVTVTSVTLGIAILTVSALAVIAYMLGVLP